MKQGSYVLLALSLLVLGCQSPDSKDSIKVETKKFVDLGSQYQFYTNETSMLETQWYRYWSNNGSLSDTTVFVKKPSGAPRYGYGIVFGLVDGSNYYRLLIHTQQRAQLYKVVGGEWTALTGTLDNSWTDATALLSGTKAENKVQIVRVTGAQAFSVYFNDVWFGTYSIDPSLDVNSAGFFATVADAATEDFPDTPVDIRYRMTAPWAIPSGAKSAVVPNSIEGRASLSPADRD